jgi:hypothetical protein
MHYSYFPVRDFPVYFSGNAISVRDNDFAPRTIAAMLPVQFANIVRRIQAVL